jgi:DNA-binding transcriptional LysR family regulator
MPDPDLRDLDAFAAVARHRSFRRAAEEQRVSVSHLSQRLRDLEERLGMRLLNRTTRSVAPTEAGERLLARLAPALDEVRGALGDLRRLKDEVSGRLRINAPPPAIDLVLAPMVAPFLARHPGVEMEVVGESNLIDIVGDGYDAGVRWEENLARDMIAVSLGPAQRYVLVASPALVARVGAPEAPEDLLDKPCIAMRFPGRPIRPWEFERDGRVVTIVPQGPLVALHIGLQIRAALDGVGFLAAFEGYVREHVMAGRLVTVLDAWLPPFPGPFLYYPSRRQPPPSLAAFVSFVAEWRRRHDP